MLEMLCQAAFEGDLSRLDVAAVRRWGWTIVSSEYPVFDVIFEQPKVEPLRLRLDATQWDELPPSVRLLQADGTDVAKAPPGISGIFHPGLHPLTQRYFVCMRGTREYHTHFSHLNDLWSSYRGTSGNDLMGIVVQIYRAWKKATG